MTDADSIRIDRSVEYHTVSGRKVYGGGGIMPDYFVPIDTTYYTDYYLALRDKGAIVQENLKLIDAHRSEWKEKYKTFERFNKRFEVSDEMLEDLISLGKTLGAEFKEDEYKTALPLIKIQLKALIARDLWDMNEYFQVINRLSDSMNKAIELLERPEEEFLKRGTSSGSY